MADAVKVAAETQLVVISHNVHHVGQMPVHAFNAGVVKVLFQELTGEVNAHKASGLYQRF